MTTSALSTGSPRGRRRRSAVASAIAPVAAVALALVSASGRPLAAAVPTTLVPTALQKAVVWRYTVEKPGEGWNRPELDDSKWKTGPAGFGSRGTPGAKIGTPWNTPDVRLRTRFEHDGREFRVAALRVHHDEDVAVYLNGEKIFAEAWYVTEYGLHDVTAALRKALKKGTNVLAVSCHQTSGGQYVDVGLVLDPQEPILKRPTLPPLKPLFDYPLRDPSIVIGPDRMYYLTGTTGFPTWWKTNEGIRVWKSPDLKQWEPLGLVWKIEDGTWQKKLHGDLRALWAPEIHYLKGTFWLTYSMNFGGCGLLRSTSGKAQGPYVDVHPSGPLTGNIDASLFADDDGKVYFVWQNGMIARLNDQMTELVERPRHLKPSNHQHVGFEGAFLIKIDGRYHLVCAEFNSGSYDCMIATAEKIDGPYGPRYLAVPHGGHNMLFRDLSGQWWSTLFGSDPRAPIQERPAILRITRDAEGRVRPLVGP